MVNTITKQRRLLWLFMQGRGDEFRAFLNTLDAETIEGLLRALDRRRLDLN